MAKGVDKGGWLGMQHKQNKDRKGRVEGCLRD